MRELERTAQQHRDEWAAAARDIEDQERELNARKSFRRGLLVVFGILVVAGIVAAIYWGYIAVQTMPPLSDLSPMPDGR